MPVDGCRDPGAQGHDLGPASACVFECGGHGLDNRAAAAVGTVVAQIEGPTRVRHRVTSKVRDGYRHASVSGVDPHHDAGVRPEAEAACGAALTVLAGGAGVGKLFQQPDRDKLIDRVDRGGSSEAHALQRIRRSELAAVPRVPEHCVQARSPGHGISR